MKKKTKSKLRGRLVNPLCFRTSFWLMWEDTYCVSNFYYANLFFFNLRIKNFARYYFRTERAVKRGYLIDNVGSFFDQGQSKMHTFINCYNGPFMTWKQMVVKRRSWYKWMKNRTLVLLKCFLFRFFFYKVNDLNFFKFKLFARNILWYLQKGKWVMKNFRKDFLLGFFLSVYRLRDKRRRRWAFRFKERFMFFYLCFKELTGFLMGIKVSLAVSYIDNNGVSAYFMCWFYAMRLKQKYQHKECLWIFKGECFTLMFRWGILRGFKIKFKGRFKRRQRRINFWFFEGSMPFSTVSGYIDFGFTKIPLKFSVLGISIWLHKPHKKVGNCPLLYIGNYGV